MARTVLDWTVMRGLRTAVLASVVALAAPASAGAQQGDQGGNQGDQGGGPGGNPKVIELDEIRIEGRVQKPNAFYILNRSNIGYEVMDLRTSFVRDVIRSVQKEPF